MVFFKNNQFLLLPTIGIVKYDNTIWINLSWLCYGINIPIIYLNNENNESGQDEYSILLLPTFGFISIEKKQIFIFNWLKFSFSIQKV